jgi:hypothetical protein
MTTQTLRDRHGNKTGDIKELGGKQVIFDKHGNKLGEFDPKLNITKDKRGNKVGYGNLLSSLLVG